MQGQPTGTAGGGSVATEALVDAAVPRAATGPQTPMDWLALTAATFFGTGKLPVAPGTWGSLATVLLYPPLLGSASTLTLLAAIVVVTVVGVASATAAERVLGKHDPGQVVIDEVAGQLVSVVLVHHLGLVSLNTLVVSFLAFRVFDVLKPFPCYQLQALPRGWGVMCDDLFAGVYAALVTYAAALLLG